MLLYFDEYQTLKHNRELSLIEMDWTDASSRLIDKSYVTRFRNATDYISKYRPQHLLANMEKMVYNGTSDLKKWFDREIYSKLLKSGVQKLAFVNSHDILTRLVLNEVIPKKENAFETKSFDSEEQAKNWLLNGINAQ